MIIWLLTHQTERGYAPPRKFGHLKSLVKYNMPICVFQVNFRCPNLIYPPSYGYKCINFDIADLDVQIFLPIHNYHPTLNNYP